MKIDRFLKDAGIMFFANILSNICNLLYQLFMVRALIPEDYGVLNSLMSVALLVSMPAGPLQAVVAKFVAVFKARNEHAKIKIFLSFFLKKLLLVAALLFLFFFIFNRQVAAFFHIDNSMLIILLGAVLMVSAILPFNLGGLQGLQKFKSLGAASIFNALLRLIVGVVLVSAGLGVAGALWALILGSLTAIYISFLILKRYFVLKSSKRAELEDEAIDLPEIFRYFLPAFIALPSFAMLTNVDILMVKHFFPPVQAGYYSVAQMIGKIILFLPGAVTIVMFPKISEHHARKENTKKMLKKGLLITGLVCFSASIFCVAFPNFVLRILAGKIYPECLPLVMPFAVSMGFFSLDSVFLYYYLAIHRTKEILFFCAIMVLQVILILFFHSTLLEVLYVLIACSVSLFFINLFRLKKVIS